MQTMYYSDYGSNDRGDYGSGDRDDCGSGDRHRYSHKENKYSSGDRHQPLPREDDYNSRERHRSLHRQDAIRRKRYTCLKDLKGFNQLDPIFFNIKDYEEYINKDLINAGPSLDFNPGRIPDYDKYSLQNVNHGNTDYLKSNISSSRNLLNPDNNKVSALNTSSIPKSYAMNIESDVTPGFMQNSTFYGEPGDFENHSHHSNSAESYRLYRNSIGDFDPESSALETASRFSYTDKTSSLPSSDVTSPSEIAPGDYDEVIYDDVYDETANVSDDEIYENFPEESDDFTDSSEWEGSVNNDDYEPNGTPRDDLSPLANKIPFRKSSDQRKPSFHYLSPVDYVNSDLSLAQRVALEIVETEQTYVKNLQEIIMGYMHDLSRCQSDSITSQDHSTLFGNINDIYLFNRELLKELIECRNDPVRVASCFVNKSHGFTIYSSYCNNYPRSMEVLMKFMSDPKISEVIRVTQACLGHSLALGAYLLKPVQRILKYHLLFQNMEKHYENDETGSETIRQAVNTMTDMARDINEMKRKHEHAIRIQELSGQLEDYDGPDLSTLGDLVMEGALHVYGAKATRQVFLFESAILVAKQKECGLMSTKAFIMFNNLMLVESVPKEPQSFHIIPFDNPKMQCTLMARRLETKRKWCQEIKRLILDSYKDKIPEKAKMLVMELGHEHDEDSGIITDDRHSAYKHHNAPGYLKKRTKRRRKSGTFIDFALKSRKVGTSKKSDNSDWKSMLPLMNSVSSTEAVNGSVSSPDVRESAMSAFSNEISESECQNFENLPYTATVSSFDDGKSVQCHDRLNRTTSNTSRKAVSDTEVCDAELFDSDNSVNNDSDNSNIFFTYSVNKVTNESSVSQQKVKISAYSSPEILSNQKPELSIKPKFENNGHRPLRRITYMKNSANLINFENNGNDTSLQKNINANVASQILPESDRILTNDCVDKDKTPNTISSADVQVGLDCNLIQNENLNNPVKDTSSHIDRQSCLTKFPIKDDLTAKSSALNVSQGVKIKSLDDVIDEPLHPVMRNLAKSKNVKKIFYMGNGEDGRPMYDNNCNIDAKLNNKTNSASNNTAMKKPVSGTRGLFYDDSEDTSNDDETSLIFFNRQTKGQPHTERQLKPRSQCDYSSHNENRLHSCVKQKSINNRNTTIDSDTENDMRSASFAWDPTDREPLYINQVECAQTLYYRKHSLAGKEVSPSPKNLSKCIDWNNRRATKQTYENVKIAPVLSEKLVKQTSYNKDKNSNGPKLIKATKLVHSVIPDEITGDNKSSLTHSDGSQGQVTLLAQLYNSQEEAPKTNKIHSQSFLNNLDRNYNKINIRSKSLDETSQQYFYEEFSRRRSQNIELKTASGKSSVTTNKSTECRYSFRRIATKTDNETNKHSPFKGNKQRHTIHYLENTCYPAKNNAETFDDYSGDNRSKKELYPDIKEKPRLPIMKVVKMIEENSKPKPTYMIDVKKRKTSSTIKERLRSLQENAKYHRERTSIEIPRNDDIPTKSLSMRKAELFLRSQTVEDPQPHKISVKRGLSLAARPNNAPNSVQLGTMRGWVQQLINRFQAEQ